MLYWITKSLHMFTAIATISGFMLRGYWMMTESDRLQLRITRIAPHIIDTIFLLSGIALVFMLHLNAFTQPWLLAKLAAVTIFGATVLVTLRIKLLMNPGFLSNNGGRFSMMSSSIF